MAKINRRTAEIEIQRMVRWPAKKSRRLRWPLPPRLRRQRAQVSGHSPLPSGRTLNRAAFLCSRVRS